MIHVHYGLLCVCTDMCACAYVDNIPPSTENILRSRPGVMVSKVETRTLSRGDKLLEISLMGFISCEKESWIVLHSRTPLQKTMSHCIHHDGVPRQQVK